MKKSALFVVLAIFVLLNAVAFAQDEEEQGKWRNFEVGASIGLTMPSNIDWYDTLKAKTGLNFGAFGGYYLTDRICFGAYFTYTQMKTEKLSQIDVSDQHYKMHDLGIYGKYAFAGESNFEPYVKLSAGANFLKFATWTGEYRTILRELSYDPVFSGGAYLGAMYYTSEYGAIFIEASYHIVMSKYTEGDYQGRIFTVPEDIKYPEVKAGVVVFFGSE